MKKMIFLIGCVLLVGIGPVVAGDFVSPTLEVQKCKKISDREERNHCLARWQEEKEDREKVELFTDTEDGGMTKEKCLQFTQSLLRAECIVEYQKQQRKKQQKETLQEEFTPPEKPELFLKIIPCENKATRMEKIRCLNDFHSELLEKEKQQAEQDKTADTQEDEPVIVSPTLQILECKKISDKTERNECYTQLRETEQQKQEERLRQEIEEFDATQEERKCREIKDVQDRAKCFHRFEQLQNRIIRNQESTFQPSDVRRGR